MAEEELVWDSGQSAVFEALESGGHIHVVGGPGTGKTSVAVEAMRVSLAEGASEPWWAPALALVPDRRRAVSLEAALAKKIRGRSLSGLSSDGSHRLVRSLSSYAYLVTALWMVEREEPGNRPTMLSGAKEDAWLQAFLVQNPGGFSPEVAGSEPFRMEIRNLIARAGQLGVLPLDLVELGQTLGLPIWRLAGNAYGEYAGWDRAFNISTPHLDAARIPRVAAHLLRNWEADAEAAGVLAPVPLPKRLIVDDAQDLPASALPLVQVMADLGVQVLISSSVNEAVAGFRGGDPGMGEEIAQTIGCVDLKVDVNHRNQGAVKTLVSGMGRWFADASSPRSAAVADAADAALVTNESLIADIVATQSQQNARVIGILREAHLYGGVPWDQMAVVVRHAGSLQVMQDALVRADIPVTSGERPVVLSRIPICAVTLALLAGSDAGDVVGADGTGESDLGLPDGCGQSREENEENKEKLALQLVGSPLVRVDSLGVFRVLRDFRLTEPTNRALGVAGLLDAIGQGKYAPSEAHLRQTWKQLKTAARIWTLRGDASGLSAEQGLWSIWNAADLGEELREKSLQGDYRGRFAVDELDAMLALFRKADLWNQERMELDLPDGTAALFAKEILSQSVATDPLVPAGLADPGVTVATPTQAAGDQWDLVVIADLQEGSWPSAARAGLGALSRLERIAQEASSRGWNEEGPVADYLPDAGALERPHQGTEAGQRRREEARLLYVAVSRPRQKLHLISVSNEDAAPSTFLSALAEDGLLQMRPAHNLWDAGPPLTLDSVVARARRTLVGEDAGSGARADAAKVLALLSRSGLTQADPQNWAVTGSLSTDNPILEQGRLRLSPSKLGQAQDCGLRWFLGSIGGDSQEIEEDPTDLNAARMGSLIHEIAEENPRGTPEELLAALHAKWAEQGFGTETVWQRRALNDAEIKVARLGRYLSTYDGELLIEQTVRFEVPGARISGRADRIEIDAEGRARVIDIKTGDAGSPAKAQENPQLFAYQVGVAEAGFVPGGAALLGLQLSTDMLRSQDALTEEQIEETRENFGLLAKKLSGARLEANPITGGCSTCAFVAVCPAKPASERNCE